LKIVYAPDSYGGFLSAPAACRLVVERLADQGLELRGHPMADGGEGTLEVLAFHGGHRWRAPHGAAPWGRYRGALVLESALLLGPGLPAMASSWHARSSFAVGAALRRAEARDEEGPFVVGLGGTATMDGGAGAIQGLGLSLLDARGRALPSGLGGAELERVRSVAGRPALGGHLLELLCDVQTALAQAPAFYGPQKGLSPADTARQREGFQRWAELLNTWRQRQGWPELPATLPGGGAAGGLGYALAAVARARMTTGVTRLALLTGLREALAGADVVVLGEGRMDRTSFEGKVADEVISIGREEGVSRVLALVGQQRAQELPPPPRGPDLVLAAGGDPSMERFLEAADRLGRVLKATVE